MGTRHNIEEEFAKLDKKVSELQKLVSTVRKLHPDLVEEAKNIIKQKARKAKVKKGVCERCGVSGATWMPNPYQQEVEGKDEFEWLCDDCSDRIAEDI